MPKQESVNLNVQPGSNNGQGWVNVNAANGQPYSFKYTGGDYGNGGLETMVGQGTATLVVSLSGSNNRYSMSGVQFTDDPNEQLSAWGDSNSITITDINTGELNGDYAITVLDSNVNTTIVCDPMIKNDPKNPPQMDMDVAIPRLVHRQQVS